MKSDFPSQELGSGTLSPAKIPSPIKNSMHFKTPHDDDFDPKHFVKRVDTDLVFDSDGEPEVHGKGNRQKFSSIRLAPDESLSQQKFLQEGSSLFPDDKPFEIKLTKDQFQTIKPQPQIQADVSQRKFSGIHEDAYFQFVEDYDNFIGQFTSDDKVKIVRGFLDHNQYNRIYITQNIISNHNWMLTRSWLRNLDHRLQVIPNLRNRGSFELILDLMKFSMSSWISEISGLYRCPPENPI